MMRSASCFATGVAVLVLAATLNAQATPAASGGPASRPAGPIVPSFKPSTPGDPATRPATAVVPSLKPSDSTTPASGPVAPVVTPSPEPAEPDVAPPAEPTGPTELSEQSKKLATKYAKSLPWLKLAEKEAAAIDKSQKGIGQQRDYVYGVLMSDYVKIGDIAAARRAYEQISAAQQPYWVGSLIAGMLVQRVDEQRAMAMLSAISDPNIRTIILRQIAQGLTKLETLDALQIVRKLPEADQPAVLIEWIVGLTLEGRLVDARVASEGANSPKLKDVTGVLDQAGQVMHGKKTIAEAQADSGKDPKEFMGYLVAVDWSRVKDLDPNVAMGVLKVLRPDPARASLDISMAKNFIKQRKFKAAETFANTMVQDLRPVPTRQDTRPALP